jgi:hypothetical protein
MTADHYVTFWAIVDDSHNPCKAKTLSIGPVNTVAGTNPLNTTLDVSDLLMA